MTKRRTPPKPITDLEDIPYASDTQVTDEEYIIEVNNEEDRYVVLYSKWRKFVSSLSNDEKKVVRNWACGDCNEMTPQTLDMWARAIKGNLKK